jgi:hypothetical protein
MKPNSEVSLPALHYKFNIELLQNLNKFWTLNEISVPITKLKLKDQSSKILFIIKHRRNTSGKYVVMLILKGTPFSVCEEIRRITLGSLHHIRCAKFNRDPTLAKDYSNFIDDYINLRKGSLQ